MVDDRDEDIFELTEDMASDVHPESNEDGSGEDVSVEAPQPSEVSEKSGGVVIRRPIRLNGGAGLPAIISPPESDAPKPAADLQRRENLDDVGSQDGYDDEILDLGVDMVVADSDAEEPYADSVVIEEGSFTEATTQADAAVAEEMDPKPEAESDAENDPDSEPKPEPDPAPESETESIEEKDGEEPSDDGEPAEDGLDVDVDVDVDLADGTQDAPALQTPDLGTPEAVFDAVEEETPDAGDVDPEEDAEELELEEVEEITPPQAPRPSSVSGLFPGAARHPKIRRKRKRPKEWWEDIFDDDYLSLLPEITSRDLRRQTDAIEQGLNLKTGSLVLDLACGDGRHAVEMAARGYRMVGVDLSLPMLAKAGETAQEKDQEINFIHGDMRDLGFDQILDGAYCVGTSFGYFDEQTNQKVLDGIARALKPGASFVLEVANRDFAIFDQPNLTWFQGVGSVCMEETTVNYFNSRLNVVRQLIMGDNSRQTRHEVSIRLYSLHELGAMFTAAGFAVSRVSGNAAAPGAFFGVDSPHIIIHATRRK